MGWGVCHYSPVDSSASVEPGVQRDVSQCHHTHAKLGCRWATSVRPRCPAEPCDGQFAPGKALSFPCFVLVCSLSLPSFVAGTLGGMRPETFAIALSRRRGWRCFSQPVSHAPSAWFSITLLMLNLECKVTSRMRCNEFPQNLALEASHSSQFTSQIPLCFVLACHCSFPLPSFVIRCRYGTFVTE